MILIWSLLRKTTLIPFLLYHPLLYIISIFQTAISIPEKSISSPNIKKYVQNSSRAENVLAIAPITPAITPASEPTISTPIKPAYVSTLSRPLEIISTPPRTKSSVGLDHCIFYVKDVNYACPSLSRRIKVWKASKGFTSPKAPFNIKALQNFFRQLAFRDGL